MTVRERLTAIQVSIVRSLAKRGGTIRPVSLEKSWHQKFVLPLLKRGLIEIWYRQSPGETPALQGPYFGLTIGGAQLASHFLNPAPRGLSGAEQSS
jgi:hypothetical protein